MENTLRIITHLNIVLDSLYFVLDETALKSISAIDGEQLEYAAKLVTEAIKTLKDKR